MRRVAMRERTSFIRRSDFSVPEMTFPCIAATGAAGGVLVVPEAAFADAQVAPVSCAECPQMP
jgi:hypothetical protein